MSPEKVRPPRELPGRPRVLLLGAGGWFGQTTLDLLQRRAPEWKVLPFTGRARNTTIGQERVSLLGWDENLAAEWQPTIVVNCAFLTRDRVSDLGQDRYAAENAQLTSRFLWTLGLPSVTCGLTISSGAACATDGREPSIADNAYGYLKRREEELATALAHATGKDLVIARAWSVSGPFVRRPRAYAFSDLVLQSLAGHVEVRAGHQVWRRYVSVEDLMQVSLARLVHGFSGIIDSGGDLVEIRELADRVTELVGNGAPVNVAEPDGSEPDRYHSDGLSWRQSCDALEFPESSLDDQIRKVAHAFADRVD